MRLFKVVRRRHGGNNRECNGDWENDDDYIRLRIVKRVGCVPPHWRKHITSILNMPLRKEIDSYHEISKLRETDSINNCSNKDEMKQFMTPAPYYVHSEFLQSYPFACDTVQAIYHTKEIILHKESGQWFVLDIYVHTHNTL